MLIVFLMRLWLSGRVPTKNFTGFGPLFPCVAPFYKSQFLFGEKSNTGGALQEKTEKKKQCQLK